MPDATTIKELSFAELYLGHASLEDRSAPAHGGEAHALEAGPALREDIDRLVAACRSALDAAPGSARHRVVHDGVGYHVSLMQTAGGDVFVLRRLDDSVRSLAELGLPKPYIRRMNVRDLQGLFLLSGPPKAGKTSAACAMVKQRLTAYGGVAVTDEELIELPLEGTHGAGICYQTRGGRGVRDGRGGREALRHVLRSGAQTILLDQIGDPQTAAAALHASVEGNLIISTIVAESIVQAVSRIEALAAQQMPQASARALLADGLAGVLHQQVRRGPLPVRSSELLFMKDTPIGRNALRDGHFAQFAGELRSLNAAMLLEGASYAPGGMLS